MGHYRFLRRGCSYCLHLGSVQAAPFRPQYTTRPRLPAGPAFSAGLCRTHRRGHTHHNLLRPVLLESSPTHAKTIRANLIQRPPTCPTSGASEEHLPHGVNGPSGAMVCRCRWLMLLNRGDRHESPMTDRNSPSATVPAAGQLTTPPEPEGLTRAHLGTRGRTSNLAKVCHIAWTRHSDVAGSPRIRRGPHLALITSSGTRSWV